MTLSAVDSKACCSISINGACESRFRPLIIPTYTCNRENLPHTGSTVPDFFIPSLQELSGALPPAQPQGWNAEPHPADNTLFFPDEPPTSGSFIPNHVVYNDQTQALVASGSWMLDVNHV